MYYTGEQIVERSKQIEGFKGIPQNYWLAFIRRNLDDQKPNEFNDVANLMFGEQLVFSTTCTTVPGLPALKGGYKKYNKKGACVLKSDVWMYETFGYGLHNGRMECLREILPVWSYRDGDENEFAAQLGDATFGYVATNIHAATYNIWLDPIIKLIGHWSYGCIVWNVMKTYREMIRLCKPQKRVSAIILNEFPI